MKKNIIKSAVMVAVFIIALIFFSVLTNQNNEDMTETMQEASLPVICFTYDDVEVNELHGYVNAMDVTAMRDTITPIKNDRFLNLKIATYGENIDGIFYEIRSLDGERLVAESEVTDYTTDKQGIYAKLQIQNLLTENEEYNLIVKLNSDDREIYYYTRLIQTESYSAEECMEFALKFHDYTFREDADSFIPTYMDPATGDATTLNYVDLTCTLKQITWADFEGERLSEPIVDFKEINDSYNVVILKYIMTSVNESGETEYYNIEEYYRLRLTSTRMYVLNFERTMNQIFRGENAFLQEGSNVLLGIRNAKVEYGASEAKDILCFVQEGELWCYNVNSENIVKVFSFLEQEGIGTRENWDQHDIKIIRVDEAGSVDFIVYGYMNRGVHEGEVGMVVYHYDGLAHTLEEEAFISSDKSYEMLKAEMGQFMYENEIGELYLMMAGNVVCINLNTLEVKMIVEGLSENCYAISESNRFLAWVESAQQYSSSTLFVMDFKTGQVSSVNAADSYCIRPLGFVQEDLIYGIAKKDNVMANGAGNMQFPMNEINIMEVEDQSNTIVKTYQKDSYYIMGIQVADYIISVNLAVAEDGQYVMAGTDSIMNHEADAEETIRIKTIVTDAKETQFVLTTSKKPKTEKIKMIVPKELVMEETKEIDVDWTREEERFYVHVKGEVRLATNSITEAIQCANEELGVVVDDKMSYLWKRARKNSQPAFSNIKVSQADETGTTIAQCVSAILMRKGEEISVSDLAEVGSTPKDILESTLKDSVVLELTGCNVEDVLYYVSCGSPVFAMTGSKDAVLITGYSSNKIYYYDFNAKGTKSLSYEEADEWFSSAGNVFLTYL
ncbi:MAG: hypothetical protein J6B26_01780 [Agathobacter sp.]|nr:hypothetical protein [Agathobacter sp.]